MEKSVKLIIVENENDLFGRTFQLFATYGIEAISCPKDGLKLLDLIGEISPQAVIADVFMPNLDAIGVMKAVEQLPIQRKPAFLVTTNFSSERLEKEAYDAGG